MVREGEKLIRIRICEISIISNVTEKLSDISLFYVILSLTYGRLVG